MCVFARLQVYAPAVWQCAVQAPAVDVRLLVFAYLNRWTAHMHAHMVDHVHLGLPIPGCCDCSSAATIVNACVLVVDTVCLAVLFHRDWGADAQPWDTRHMDQRQMQHMTDDTMTKRRRVDQSPPPILDYHAGAGVTAAAAADGGGGAAGGAHGLITRRPTSTSGGGGNGGNWQSPFSEQGAEDTSGGAGSGSLSNLGRTRSVGEEVLEPMHRLGSGHRVVETPSVMPVLPSRGNTAVATGTVRLPPLAPGGGSISPVGTAAGSMHGGYAGLNVGDARGSIGHLNRLPSSEVRAVQALSSLSEHGHHHPHTGHVHHGHMQHVHHHGMHTAHQGSSYGMHNTGMSVFGGPGRLEHTRVPPAHAAHYDYGMLQHYSGMDRGRGDGGWGHTTAAGHTHSSTSPLGVTQGLSLSRFGSSEVGAAQALSGLIASGSDGTYHPYHGHSSPSPTMMTRGHGAHSPIMAAGGTAAGRGAHMHVHHAMRGDVGGGLSGMQDNEDSLTHTHWPQHHGIHGVGHAGSVHNVYGAAQHGRHQHAHHHMHGHAAYSAGAAAHSLMLSRMESGEVGAVQALSGMQTAPLPARLEVAPLSLNHPQAMLRSELTAVTSALPEAERQYYDHDSGYVRRGMTHHHHHVADPWQQHIHEAFDGITEPGLLPASARRPRTKRTSASGDNVAGGALSGSGGVDKYDSNVDDNDGELIHAATAAVAGDGSDADQRLTTHPMSQSAHMQQGDDGSSELHHADTTHAVAVGPHNGSSSYGMTGQQLQSQQHGGAVQTLQYEYAQPQQEDDAAAAAAAEEEEVFGQPAQADTLGQPGVTEEAARGFGGAAGAWSHHEPAAAAGAAELYDAAPATELQQEGSIRTTGRVNTVNSQ